jgi:hypothetical protein
MKRQGDLLIVYVSALPPGARPKAGRVLAEGEQTGHRHELTGGILYETHQELFFTVIDETQVILKHPEHNPLTFTPGIYKVIRQREYKPGDWRYVAD